MLEIKDTPIIPDNITALTTHNYEGNQHNPKYEIKIDGQAIKFEDRDERDRNFEQIMAALTKLQQEADHNDTN